MLDKDSKSEKKLHKSPARKLIRFFEGSRDKWKVKCLEAKYRIKLLTNKIRYLEMRKADLSERVKTLEKELEELKEKGSWLITMKMLLGSGTNLSGLA